MQSASTVKKPPDSRTTSPERKRRMYTLPIPISMPFSKADNTSINPWKGRTGRAAEGVSSVLELLMCALFFRSRRSTSAHSAAGDRVGRRFGRQRSPMEGLVALEDCKCSATPGWLSPPRFMTRLVSAIAPLAALTKDAQDRELMVSAASTGFST